jgi:hypothetical protein
MVFSTVVGFHWSSRCSLVAVVVVGWKWGKRRRRRRRGARMESCEEKEGKIVQLPLFLEFF